MKGQKRKSLLHWKQKIRETGWDWTDGARLSKDRKEKRLGEMKHLYSLESQKGHRYVWEEEEGTGEK